MAIDTPPPDPMFGRAPLGGKRSADVKAKVTDETKFALQRFCHQLGVTESDVVNQLLEARLFGEAHVRSVLLERFSQVVGMGQEQAMSGGAA